MTDRELMQQALDALEPISAYGRVGSRDTEQAAAQAAITALRERLALSYVPKVWMQCPECGKKSPMPDPDHKEWRGLTDEERDAFWRADQMTSAEWGDLFDAVEAALREKNA